jgi:hypothetical protein
MDSLDRMYRRLVQNLRAGYPDLLTRSFEVSLIYQQIIPYRLNRRELGLESNDEYELALLQLLSGARGLVLGDDEMQRALSEELESTNPDLSAFRAFATSTVSLVPEALRALDAQPRVRPISPAPAPAERPLAAAQAELAGRATEELTVPAAAAARAKAAAAQRPEAPPPAATAATAPAAPKPRAAPAPAPAPAPTAATAPPKPRPAAASASAPAPKPPPVAKPDPAPAPRAPVRPRTPGCRYCGAELPEGREVHFCPHCGQNLTIKQCPACSTELEVGWHFCVNCGRQVE